MDDAAEIESVKAGEAGAPEGAPVAEPTVDEVGEMYKELGIKASPPSGKPKGRPKADDGGSKKATKKDDESGEPKQDEKGDDSKDKPKATPAPDKDGVDGDEADKESPKSSKSKREDGEKDSEVHESSESDEDGVQKTESKDNKDSGESSEKDADEGDDGSGDDEYDEDVKRPGKSNPKIERRFQKLATDIHERDQVIEKLQKELQEATEKQEQAKVQQEDPEYTIDDFRKVKDEEGNVMDLDPERAELAWRRWKDGYDQRASERQAQKQHEEAQREQESQMSEQIMRSSVEAYDTLTSLMDDFPELVSTSDKYDQEFASIAMPIIHEATIYQEGTEPGNPNGAQPVIMGLKINPKQVLDAMVKIRTAKRSLPLNGTNDNVEVKSNVSVQHSRSSDPTAQAANELYKALGINKRV